MTKEEKQQYRKNRRARLKAQGLCTSCGKRRAAPKRTLCRICAERHLETERERRGGISIGALHVCNQEDGYLALAAAILKAQKDAYVRALQSYTLRRNTWSEKDAKEEVLKVEEELLSPYYAKLTLRAIDLQDYINQQRKTYDFQEE